MLKNAHTFYSSLLCPFVVRVLLLFIALFAMLGCPEKQSNQPVATSVTIRLIHPPELRYLIQSLGARFAELDAKLGDGSLVRVKYLPVGTHTAAEQIASGQLKTELWLADSSDWVTWVNANLTNLGPPQAPCAPLFSSPIVLAASSTHADKFFSQDSTGELSWPLSFAKESASEEPSFSLIHSNPTRSPVGLAALHQLVSLASTQTLDQKQSSELNEPARMKDPTVLEQVSRYESLISSYGETEANLLEIASRGKDTPLRGVITTEQAVQSFNRLHDPDFTYAFSASGVVSMDYQLCTSEADWVSPAHHAAINRFVDFLSSAEAASILSRAGYRPSQHPAENPGPALPAAGKVRPLSAGGFEALLDTWDKVRKPLALAIIIDGSGSMEGPSLDVAKEELRRMIALMEDGDSMSLSSFHSEPEHLLDFSSDKAALLEATDKLNSLGGSAVYDAIKEVAETLEKRTWQKHRRAILLYTDGDDRNSVLPELAATRSLPGRLLSANIQITILGLQRSGEHHADLKAIAVGSGGAYFESDLDGMRSLFRSYMSNF